MGKLDLAVGVAAIAVGVGGVMVDIAVRRLGMVAVTVFAVGNTGGVVLALWIVVESFVPVLVAAGAPRERFDREVMCG